MCTINKDTFFSFMKNIWIRDFNSLCHIMNDDTSLFIIIDINKLIHRSSGNMPSTKKVKLHVNVWQVDGTEWVHTLSHIKFYPKVGTNLFSITCKLLQGKKILSNLWNIIAAKSTDSDIILDHHIKTHDDWVARVEFLQVPERVQSATATHKKNINHHLVELGHPFKSITHATAKTMGI